MSLSSASPRQGRVTGRHVLIACIAFFGVVFTVNAVMISMALGTFPGVEVPSSYRAGREFAQGLEAARAQAALGWTVDAEVRRDTGGAVAVAFEPRDRAGQRIAGLTVAATVERPAERAHDHRLDLPEERSGQYRGSLQGLGAGVWTVVFEARRGTDRVYRSRHRVILP